MLAGSPIAAAELVHEAFERRAAAAPEAVAIVYGGVMHTYAALNQRANQLARFLLRKGVQIREPVAICIRRSPDMIVAVLGVLKAGAAYVPLDASYPSERLAAMLEDLGTAPFVLATRETRALVPQGAREVIEIDTRSPEMDDQPCENLSRAGSPDDIAYVVFTSGSTGRPKGAIVRYAGWANLLCWFTRQFGTCEDDRCLLISTFGFDITQRSLAMPLVAGGALHIFPETHFDAQAIADEIARARITLLNCSPSVFYPIVDAMIRGQTSCPSLRYVFLGGEPIVSSRIAGWARANPQVSIVNVYGVSECSDVSTWYRLHDYERYTRSSVPIGAPIYRTCIYVMDDALKECAREELGEICIGGVGVGAGYLNDPALTAKHFVKHEVAAGEEARLYRTGDLGTIRADGTLCLVGRKDRQVKVRGVRIELGDVEAAIRQCESVIDAVVMKRISQDDDQLVAFVVPELASPAKDSSAMAKRLRRALKERLPGPMIPSSFVLVPKLPLTPNGKVDRAALSRIDVVTRA